MNRGAARRHLDSAARAVDEAWRLTERGAPADPQILLAVTAVAAAAEALARPRRRYLNLGPLLACTVYRREAAASGPRDLVVLWRDFRHVVVRVPLPWVSDYDDRAET